MDKFPIIFICHPYLHANVYDGSNYALNDMVYAYYTKNRTNDTFHHKLNMLVALCPDLAEGPTTLLSLLMPPPVDQEEVVESKWVAHWMKMLDSMFQLGSELWDSNDDSTRTRLTKANEAAERLTKHPIASNP